MKETPVVTAYRSHEDLIELKKWFYEFDGTCDNRKRAIERVKVLLTRGRLPHGIEATSILTSVILNDDDKDFDTDTNVTQLSYTMALIRFVNGLLDPFQQSNYAIPMQLLAKQLNLPTFFVELRHMGTHENLPSLDILRIATKDALTWLYDNYWSQLDSECEGDKDVNPEADVYYEAVNFRYNHYQELINGFSVYENLRTFKRIRKDQLDTPLFADNNDSNRTTLRKCVNDLVELGTVNPQLLAKLLIRKFYLIYPQQKLESKGITYNPLLEKLYKPLLEKLSDELLLSLFIESSNVLQQKGIDEIDRRVYKKLGLATALSEIEVSQLIEWLPFITKSLLWRPLPVKKLPQIELTSKMDLIKFVCDNLESICKNDDLLLVKMLSVVKESFTNADSDLMREISVKLDKAAQRANRKALELPPSLDEILAEDGGKRKSEDVATSSTKKKSKNAGYKSETVYLMEPHENWTPTPFGTTV
ncbi:LAS1 [Candida theae]|uniref:LAS1 n=1 Tax=Candida theae TaxID=1198502 RepID=A0AAD5FZC5_9ASCO|nr:LAS1 [Candida theae]KAI5960515.1 LAS1 [Candida theae]